MQRIITAALLALGVMPAATAAEPWSLDSCISYAVSHNITVRQRQADRDMGRISLDEARAGYLPTLGAGASQNFSFGRGLTADNTYANRNTSGFGWNMSLNVPLTYAIGQGQARVSQTRTYLTQLAHQYEAARDNVELNVISSYLQVLYCRELLEVAQSQTAMSQRQLDDRRTLLSAGKIAELDVTQAESQLASDRLTEVTARGDLDMALLDLAQLMQLPDEVRREFDILPADGDDEPLLPTADEVYGTALRNNSGMLAAGDNVEYARKGITVARTAYIPSLSLSGGLGSNYYHMKGGDNEAFAHQMRHNFSQSIGLSVSVPLFDAFSRHNGVRRARASYLAAQLQLDEAREQLYKTIRTARTEAANAGERRRAAEVAADAAMQALQAVNDKYTYGRATPTEVEQAKNTYVRAAGEAVRAKYEQLLRTRILEFYNRGTGGV